MSECNSVESSDLTYYQRNRDAILNRANTETYLKEKKIKQRIWEEQVSQYV